MSFSPTITYDSKVVPGLKFTVHRMGFGRRVDLDFKTLALRQRLRELEVENPAPTDHEKELGGQLSIARHKAMAVPPEELQAVLEQDVKPLVEELNTAADVDTRKRRAVLAEEYSVIELQIRTAWIRNALISIEHPIGKGDCFDGMTADQLLEYGPPALALEIHDALAQDGKVAGEAAKNLSSPTTSGALVGGETGSTAAPGVDLQPEGSTQNETASGTSPQP